MNIDQGRLVGATELFFRLRKFLFLFLMGTAAPSRDSCGSWNTNNLSPAAGLPPAAQTAAGAMCSSAEPSNVSFVAPNTLSFAESPCWQWETVFSVITILLKVWSISLEPSSFPCCSTSSAASSPGTRRQEPGSSFSIRHFFFSWSLI